MTHSALYKLETALSMAVKAIILQYLQQRNHTF